MNVIREGVLGEILFTKANLKDVPSVSLYP